MTASKTAPRKRARRYKDAEGNYLMVTGDIHGFRVCWFCPDIDSEGSSLGERAPRGGDNSAAEQENRLAYMAAEPFSDTRDCAGFLFETERRAKEALRAADEALLSGEVWPDWARKARDAGWTPPEGWKP